MATIYHSRGNENSGFITSKANSPLDTELEGRSLVFQLPLPIPVPRLGTLSLTHANERNYRWNEVGASQTTYRKV